jgi:hypothetical protein
MSDHFKGMVVTFERDIGEEAMEAMTNALRQFRHVLDVTPSVADANDHMNRMQIRFEIQKKLWEALK